MEIVAGVVAVGIGIWGVYRVIAGLVKSVSGVVMIGVAVGIWMVWVR